MGTLSLNEEPALRRWSLAMAGESAQEAVRFCLFALSYSIAYHYGMSFSNAVASPFWFPDAVLLSALLLTPPRKWWIYVLAPVPIRWLLTGAGLPMWFLAACYANDVIKALLGAGLLRLLLRNPARFETLRDFAIYFLVAIFLTPLLSALAGAASRTVLGYEFLPAWRQWFLGDALANLILTPTILYWAVGGVSSLRAARVRSWVEVGVTTAGLAGVGLLVFAQEKEAFSSPALLYTPLPFLLWAAMRFGLRGTSAALSLIAYLAVTGALKGRGPFAGESPDRNVLSIQLFLFATGLPALFLAVLNTERSRAERSLREASDRLARTETFSLVMVTHLALDGRWLKVPPTLCRLLGCSEQNLLAGSIQERFHPEDLMASWREFGRLIRGETKSVASEARLIRRDGSIVWVYFNSSVVLDENSRPAHFVTYFQDITERKHTEDALRTSNERHRAVLEAIPDLIFIQDNQGKYVDYNAKDRSMLAAPPEWFLGRNMSEVLPPEVVSRVKAPFDRVVREGHPQVVEYSLVLGGETRHFEARLVRSGSDRVLSVVRDITNRKQAEAGLRASEERYREVVESQTDLVCRFLPDTTLTFVNEAYCRFFARRRSDLIGRRFLELIPVESREAVFAQIASLNNGSRVVTHEHEVVLPDGSTGWHQWVNHAIIGPGDVVVEFQAIGRDITDRKRAEEAKQNLAHASRLALVGELTAMIAHEINQPLGAILSNAEAAEMLLDSRKGTKQQLRGILADIRDDDLRASEAIRSIRNLLRRNDLELKLLDLNEVVAEVLRFVKGDALLRHVEIQTDLTSDLPSIHGDRVYLQQVLLNLILNGMDAMADTPEAKRWLVVGTDRRDTSQVEVRVIDNGHGIPADKLRRIFDSFFTTKTGGMGLGLSIAKSIVRTHLGEIVAENNPCGGATFRITLPAVRGN
jgi:PAS domain S-box-containing protein